MSTASSPLPEILIVDDDDDQLFITRRMVERSGVRHPITDVRGGPEAIDYLTRCCPHGGLPMRRAPALIFLDLKMPTADGFAVLTWIRSQSSLQNVKVIVLTSSDDPEDVKRCTALGAQGFLVKHPNSMVMGCVLRQALGSEALADSGCQAQSCDVPQTNTHS